MLQGCTRTFLSTHLPVLPLVFIHLIGDQNRAPNSQIYIIGKDVLCTTKFQIFPRDGLGGTVVSAILGLDFIGRTVTYLFMYLVNLVGNSNTVFWSKPQPRWKCSMYTSGSFGHCVEKMLRVNPGWNKINPISKHPQLVGLLFGFPHQPAFLVAEVLLTTQQLHVLVEDACHVLKYEEFRAVEAPESQLGSGWAFLSWEPPHKLKKRW